MAQFQMATSWRFMMADFYRYGPLLFVTYTIPYAHDAFLETVPVQACELDLLTV